MVASVTRGFFPPKERLRLPDWIERHYEIPPGNRMEGPFRFSRTPYLREIAEALDEQDPCERVVYKKPNQCGATELASAWFAWIIANGKGTILQVQPLQSDASRHSDLRIKQLEKQRVLVGLIDSAERHGTTNNMYRKVYPGGAYVLTWSTSPSGLQSTPVPYMHLDEINRYPLVLKREGRPTDIAERRAESFAGEAKIFLSSTPTHEGMSLITEYWESSTRGKYMVPCVHCGEYQWLAWEQVKWPSGEPEKAFYVCAGCGKDWSEKDRLESILNGRYQHEREWRPGLTKGFWHNGLANMWRGMSYRATYWVDLNSKPDAAENKVNFYQGILAMDTKVESIYEYSPSNLMNRLEEYDAEVPTGVLAVTAGVDVQGDRLEMEIVGWGFGEESWSIRYVVLPGSTTGSEVWDALYNVIQQPLVNADGKNIYIRGICLDANYNTREAQLFAKRQTIAEIWAIRGGNDWKSDLFPAVANRKNRYREPIRTVNSMQAKRLFYSWLSVVEPGPHYMHFPKDRGYNEDYFAGLTAERLVPEYDKAGNPTYRWEVLAGTRNEPTDCRAYAYLALEGMGIMHNIWLPMPDDTERGRENRSRIVGSSYGKNNGVDKPANKIDNAVQGRPALRNRTQNSRHDKTSHLGRPSPRPGYRRRIGGARL